MQEWVRGEGWVIEEEETSDLELDPQLLDL
jgi:hypothetical protein